MDHEPLRVVLDTNILISSLWGGNPGKVIDIWDSGRMFLMVSRKILDEYFKVLERFDLAEEDLEDIAILLANPDKTIVVEPEIRIHRIKRDPDDNKFLECAVQGKADFIISGDKHLLDLGAFRRIKIINASTFLKIFAAAQHNSIH